LRDLPEVIQRSGALDTGPSGDFARPSLSIDLGQPLERNIERIVDATLLLEHGNRSRAAERLGVSVRTIQRYLARGIVESTTLSGGQSARGQRATH
jgi:DNA-binding NtrC family response regulator